jgi:hypothetical protein
MKRLLREPLVHFFAIGLALFVLYGFLNPDDRGPDSRLITINDGDVERISSLWQMQMRRPPTADELQGLLKEHLREEVLYREARAMGLDEDDTIVRRRMAQKMSFLARGIAEQVEPTEDELRAWFADHADKYERPARLTLQHVYFSVDRRGDRVDADATALLDELRRGVLSAEGAMQKGDRFMLQHEYEWTSKRELSRAFGSAFADTVFNLEAGQWHGPVASGYGIHLVHITERSDAELPPFEEVQNEVTIDWGDTYVRDAEAKVFDELLSRYEVELSPSVDSLLAGAGIQLVGATQ